MGQIDIGFDEVFLRRWLYYENYAWTALGDFAREGRIRSIIPQPLAMGPLSDGVFAEFPARGQGRVIQIVQEPSRPGALHNQIAVEGQAGVGFTQWVLP